MENELIIVDDKDTFFMQMRELAYAQLSANCELGPEVSPEEKDKFVMEFDYELINEEEFNNILPAKVFEQYFNMFKLEDTPEGLPTISQLGLMEAVNRFIFYGFIKISSKMVDDGIMDMLCLENGDICFSLKGVKPQQFPQLIKPNIKKEIKPTKKTKSIKKKPTKPKKKKDK